MGRFHLVAISVFLAQVQGFAPVQQPFTSTTELHSYVETDFKAPVVEIERRRNLAIISHPDSGKTTMTEKLLLYGKLHVFFSFTVHLPFDSPHYFLFKQVGQSNKLEQYVKRLSKEEPRVISWKWRKREGFLFRLQL